MSDSSKPKVLIIIGDAAETVDTMYPYFRLIEGGYDPVIAAPEKRTYQMVMHQNKPGWTITKRSHRQRVSRCGNPCARRLRERTAHGHRAQGEV